LVGHGCLPEVECFFCWLGFASQQRLNTLVLVPRWLVIHGRDRAKMRFPLLVYFEFVSAKYGKQFFYTKIIHLFLISQDIGFKYLIQVLNSFIQIETIPVQIYAFLALYSSYKKRMKNIITTC